MSTRLKRKSGAISQVDEEPVSKIASAASARKRGRGVAATPTVESPERVSVAGRGGRNSLKSINGSSSSKPVAFSEVYEGELIREMSYNSLRSALRVLSLPSDGKKEELVARMIKAVNSSSKAEPATPASVASSRKKAPKEAASRVCTPVLKETTLDPVAAAMIAVQNKKAEVNSKLSLKGVISSEDAEVEVLPTGKPGARKGKVTEQLAEDRAKKTPAKTVAASQKKASPLLKDDKKPRARVSSRSVKSEDTTHSAAASFWASSSFEAGSAHALALQSDEALDEDISAALANAISESEDDSDSDNEEEEDGDEDENEDNEEEEDNEEYEVEEEKVVIPTTWPTSFAAAMQSSAAVAMKTAAPVLSFMSGVTNTASQFASKVLTPTTKLKSSTTPKTTEKTKSSEPELIHAQTVSVTEKSPSPTKVLKRYAVAKSVERNTDDVLPIEKGKSPSPTRLSSRSPSQLSHSKAIVATKTVESGNHISENQIKCSSTEDFSIPAVKENTQNVNVEVGKRSEEDILIELNKRFIDAVRGVGPPLTDQEHILMTNLLNASREPGSASQSRSENWNRRHSEASFAQFENSEYGGTGHFSSGRPPIAPHRQSGVAPSQRLSYGGDMWLESPISSNLEKRPFLMMSDDSTR